MRRLVLHTVFLLFIFPTFCQYPEINYERILDQQGLNDRYIKCLLQDRRGFIWIGGENGLYRFDGYDFVYYKDPPGCKNCPHFYPVYDIVEGNQGMLWTISYNGITLYCPEKERSWVAYRFKSANAVGSSYFEGTFLDLMKDSRGNIWATNDKGLIRFSYKENFNNKEMSLDKGPGSMLNINFFHLTQNTTPAHNLACKIYEDSEGNIWTGCIDGLYVMRKQDTSFYRLEIKTLEFYNLIHDILQENKDTFWILSSNGCYLMTNVKKALQGSIPDSSALCFTKFFVAKGQMSTTLYKDRKKNIFIGTAQDLFKFKGRDEKGNLNFQSFYDKILDKKDYLSYKTICSILEDRSGVLWIGHKYFGITKFILNGSPFISYNNLVSNAFTSVYVSPIHFDFKGNLWIGTYFGGLYKIQQQTNQITRYDLPYNSVACIEELNPGIFWVGTPGGVFEFNTFTGKFHDPFPKGEIAANLRWSGVSDILKVQNQLYITTSSGIFVYDFLKNRLVQFSYFKKDSILLSNNRIISPIKLKNGEIIAASSFHGINKINYDAKKGKLSLYCILEDSVLRSRNINLTQRFRLYQDSQGSLWMVEKTGLHKINLEKGEIYDYKIFKDIEFPEAWSIIEDNRGNLWIGTQFGLCRFSINTGQVKNFTKEDGVPVSIHEYNSAYKDKDGRLYFGGVEGFYSFHPDSINTNTYIPPIAITDLKLFNKSVKVDSGKRAILTRNIAYTKDINLKYNQNDLSFEFAALDYTISLRNLYAYRLEGFQNEWVETDASNRIATYTNLDPGTYIFRVKGSNNDGVWNEEGASLTVIIHKPWWGTLLAWCCYVLVFLGTIVGYIRWRLWRLKKEKQELERQVVLRTHQIEEQKEEILTQRDLLEQQNQQITEHEQLKTRFFTNVSHEFRTPLSLIQSPVEELLDDPQSNEKQRRKLNVVHRNARRLLNLVNQLLDISKIDGSKMKLELLEADVIKLLRVIAGNFISLAETKSIHYHVHFPSEEKITWFDPDKLEKIAVNLLSNAFKFTPEGGEISFFAEYTSSHEPETPLYLEFSVKDNGPGIPSGNLEKIFDRFYQVDESMKAEGGGTGIGLSLARDMARLLHGDISVKSETGKGSTFAVSIPLGKDHLKESEFILLKEAPEAVVFMPEFQDNIEEAIQEGRSADEKPVLLIVEDNRDIRMQLADNLNLDYVILQAIDGVAGLKKATETIPDLVITDLMMPRMDGIELCNKLKNDERTCHIPVIMLTAKVTLEDKITGFLTGADDYVPKPFHMVELKARVANLVEQRRKLRDRFSREVTLQPSDISITPLDEKFLNRAVEVVEKHIDDENFDLSELRGEMNMTRSTLFRKLHALTGQSPTEFIRTIRLKRAASLLKQNFGNVTQVSYEVGFSNPSYFNRSFKKFYGVSPMEYLRTH
jgi:signal transduction histidine kinase/ligand-binding sensor domain-containing protein/DNA-binding response OmpR family regulator